MAAVEFSLTETKRGRYKRRNSVGDVSQARLLKRKSKDDVITLDGMDLSPSAARRPLEKKGLRHPGILSSLPKRDSTGSAPASDSDREGESEIGVIRPKRPAPKGYVSPFDEVDKVNSGSFDKVSRVMGTDTKEAEVVSKSKTIKFKDSNQRKFVKNLFFNTVKRSKSSQEEGKGAGGEDSTPTTPSQHSPLTPSTPAIPSLAPDTPGTNSDPSTPTFTSQLFSPSSESGSARDSPTEDTDKWGDDGSRKVMQSGTLKELVQSFLDESPDFATSVHLFLAHRQFLPSQELMATLLDVFKTIKPDDAAHKIKFYNLFKTWISWDGPGIVADEKAMVLLEDFLQEMRKDNPAISEHLFNLLGTKMESSVAKPKESHIEKLSGRAWTFLDIELVELDTNVLAQQLSLFEHRLIKKISLDEYYETRWTKDKAENIGAAYAFVNKFSHALMHHILCHARDEFCIAAWSKVVSLGKALIQYQNYNALLAVYLALQNGKVEKILEGNKKSISGKLFKAQKEIADLMSPSHNFSSYRSALKNVNGAYIPCYEVHLKDLLYTTDGNPNWHDKEKGILNLYKLDSMGKTILSLHQPIKSAFDFPEDKELQSLLGTIKDLSVDEMNANMANLLQRANSLRKNSSKRLKDAHSHSHSHSAAYSSSDEKTMTTSSSTNSLDPLLNYDLGSLPTDPAQREEALLQALSDLKTFAAILQRKERDLERRERELDLVASGAPLSRSGSKKH